MEYKETSLTLTINKNNTEAWHKEKFEVLSENLQLLKKKLKNLENYEPTHSLKAIKINYEEIVEDYQNIIKKIKLYEKNLQELEIKLRNSAESIAEKHKKTEANENLIQSLNLENEELIIKLENAKNWKISKASEISTLTQKLSELKESIFQQKDSKIFFSEHFEIFFSKKKKMQEKKNELEKKRKILKDLENYNQQIDISLHKSSVNFDNYTRRHDGKITDYDELIKETNENVTLSQSEINSLYLNSLTSFSNQNFENPADKSTHWLCCSQTETLLLLVVVIFSIFFVYKVTLVP